MDHSAFSAYSACALIFGENVSHAGNDKKYLT